MTISFTTGAGEGVHEAGKGAGIAAEFVIEISSFEMAQREEKASDGELKGALVKFRGIEIMQDVEGRFLFRAQILEPFLLEKPVLIGGAVVPVGDVARGDALGFVAEGGKPSSPKNTATPLPKLPPPDSNNSIPIATCPIANTNSSSIRWTKSSKSPAPGAR